SCSPSSRSSRQRRSSPRCSRSTAASLLIASAVPLAGLQLTPGATAGIRQYPQSVRGLNVLEDALGSGAVAPAQVLVDAGVPGGVRQPAVQVAIGRLVAGVRRDPEVGAVY